MILKIILCCDRCLMIYATNALGLNKKKFLNQVIIYWHFTFEFTLVKVLKANRIRLLNKVKRKFSFTNEERIETWQENDKDAGMREREWRQWEWKKVEERGEREKSFKKTFSQFRRIEKKTCDFKSYQKTSDNYF